MSRAAVCCVWYGVLFIIYLIDFLFNLDLFDQIMHPKDCISISLYLYNDNKDIY